MLSLRDCRIFPETRKFYTGSTDHEGRPIEAVFVNGLYVEDDPGDTMYFLFSHSPFLQIRMGHIYRNFYGDVRDIVTDAEYYLNTEGFTWLGASGTQILPKEFSPYFQNSHKRFVITRALEAFRPDLLEDPDQFPNSIEQVRDLLAEASDGVLRAERILNTQMTIMEQQ